MGSARGLTDAAGSVTDTYRYDAYGLPTTSSGATVNPYLYRGEQYDAALDAYYLRARYYQPGIGRFLTTDPVEGMMGDPFSAHRYLYGASNPVMNIDPSGKIALMESLFVAGIVTNLAGWGMETAASIWENFGDSLAEWLPDAGLIGISGYFSLKVLKVLDWILGDTSLNCTGFDESVGLVAGIDFLFSISSSQYGRYIYSGGQIEWGNYSGTQLPINVGASIYHGWVWNLWNTANYTGPFVSANGGFGPYGSVSLFKDATSLTFEKGPFGISFSALNWSPFGDTWTFGLAYTNYPMEGRSLGLIDNYRTWNEPAGMFEVASRYAACQLAMLTFASATTNAVGIVSSIGSASWANTIAVSKNIWNRKNHNDVDASVQKRQTVPRPPNFRSGPQRWIFWGGY